ncbi:MAG: alpha/beta hydrolase [Rhizobiaceae bacterium]|nr:alpha/beta hydrolase [Rhizobiaceae bacterium]
MTRPPPRWRRRLAWAGGGFVVAVLCCFALLVWTVAGFADRVLTIGSPIAQGVGEPAAGRPEDIGYSGDPLLAFGYPFQAVDLAGELGPTPAWLVAPETRSGDRWAIFVHGIGGRRENGYRFLPALRSLGLPTLMISYRGDPEAPAAPDGRYALGLTEWRDLDAAVRFAREGGARSIVLVAESMGGAIVGQFLRRSSQAADIDALVLDAPMIDLAATLAAILRARGIPLPRTVAAVALKIEGRRNSIDLSQADVTPEVAAFPGPLFLSHGSADRIVPVATSDGLAEARGGSTTYVRTAADHIKSWKIDPGEYETRLKTFLFALPPG